MKEYDLSQYILETGNVLLFPLTKDEVHCLLSSTQKFSEHILIPYYAKEQSKEELTEIYNKVNMENDYWFLDTQWVCVDKKAKSIVGYLRLEPVDQFNKIVMQVSDDKCESITREDVFKLFYRFLAGNDYYNIILQDIDKTEVSK